MHDIIARPIAWNKARYEQEYNYDLTCDLLYEEYEEFMAAVLPVDKLDALVDIYFVAIGALWKMDIDVEGHMHYAATTSVTANPETLEKYLTRLLEAEDIRVQRTSVALLAYTAIEIMKTMGLSDAQVCSAIRIVCDSNDTKPVVKTASHIKANIDKDYDFIPPEPRLQLLLDEVNNGT